jgi:hypothetical protein
LSRAGYILFYLGIHNSAQAGFFVYKPMTQYEKIKKLILISFLLLVCSALIYIYTTPTKQDSSQESIPIIKVEEQGMNQATLEINGIRYENNISKQANIYSFMEQLQNEGKINFKDKTYSGMGKFIEEINGIKNGTKSWIYYINGKKANIGISNYQINKGDVISWKYE